MAPLGLSNSAHTFAVGWPAISWLWRVCLCICSDYSIQLIQLNQSQFALDNFKWLQKIISTIASNAALNFVMRFLARRLMKRIHSNCSIHNKEALRFVWSTCTHRSSLANSHIESLFYFAFPVFVVRFVEIKSYPFPAIFSVSQDS